MINDNVDKVMPQADGKVPARRFPEFRNSTPWQERVLDEVSYCLNNKRIPLNSQQRINKKGNIPYYGANGIVDYINEYIFDEEIILLAEDGGNFVDYREKPIAQYIYSKCWVNNHAHVLKAKQNGLFLFYSLVHKNIIPYIKGSSRAKLNKVDMLAVPIYIPFDGVREQEKIAECLSSIDSLISAKQTELESLKKYKKGLLQQLFPQGNNNLPALRFPEFKNSPPWQETKLERICRSISSGRDKRSDDGNYDLFGSTGIIGKTSDKTYNGKFILVARVGANAGLLTKVNSIFGATDNTLVIDLDDNTNIDFIFASLDKFRLNRLVFGSGQPLITGRQLKDISISLPDSTEQKKIANCLTSLDNLIEIKQQELDKLSRYKKGLLQQLLVQG